MISHWTRIAGVALFLLGAAVLTAAKKQTSTTMPDGTPQTFVLSGSVVLPDGVLPERIVTIERVCGGRVQGITYVNSKGRYKFDLGVLYDRTQPELGGVQASSFADCSIRANLEGYRAQPIALGPLVAKKNPSAPQIMLQPSGKEQGASLSATDAGISKNAKKDYEKGLDLTADTKWREAIAAMEKAASEDAKFASAWLSLGMLQVFQRDNQGGVQSYAKAIAADDKFATPYVELATIEANAAQWDQVIEHTNKVIALAPDSFPRAYYLNAIANIRLEKTDAALVSADEGIRVDQDHHFPDLVYIRGMLLGNKGDTAGARTGLQSYLEIAPNGENAENAREQLKTLPSSK